METADDGPNMSQRTTRRRFLAGGAAAALTAVAGCASTTPFVGQRLEESETLPVDDAEAVAVDTETGSVTVRTADREDVHVDIVKQSSSVTADVTDLEFRTEHRDGRLRLFSEWTGGDPLFGSRPGMDLDVTVPSTLPVGSAGTATGAVDVAGTTGDLSVTTSTGAVEVRDVAGDVDASATTGAVELRGVEGMAAATASTGAVEIRDVGRLGDVETATGSIDVDVPALAGDVTVEATTGSVDAALASDLDAELRVSTTTGGITFEGVDLDVDRREEDLVAGTLGEGGPRLDVETTTGGVTLRRLN